MSAVKEKALLHIIGILDKMSGERPEATEVATGGSVLRPLPGAKEPEPKEPDEPDEPEDDEEEKAKKAAIAAALGKMKSKV